METGKLFRLDYKSQTLTPNVYCWPIQNYISCPDSFLLFMIDVCKEHKRRRFVLISIQIFMCEVVCFRDYIFSPMKRRRFNIASDGLLARSNHQIMFKKTVETSDERNLTFVCVQLNWLIILDKKATCVKSKVIEYFPSHSSDDGWP